MPRSAAAVGALCATLLVAASAQAATQTVYMGAPAASQKAFASLGADVNAYFPRTVTIHRGDTVRFLPAGFHDVNLPPRGQKPIRLLSATGAISGVDDANGTPYWFNGQQNLQFTPQLLGSNFGRTATYDGSRGTVSGIPLGNQTKPFSVRFTKTGTFTFSCNIHSGMKGTVRVLGPSAKVPTKASVAKTVSRDVTAALRDAKSLQTAQLPADTIQIGNSSASGVEIYAMYASSTQVKVGTTLTFELSRYSHDIHTATTGPGTAQSPGTFLGHLAASISSGGPIDQQAMYPSDPRPGPTALTPALHGNGFWGTGFMDTDPSTPQPKSAQVTIVAPGTYTFFDLLHPFMQVTITATD